MLETLLDVRFGLAIVEIVAKHLPQQLFRHFDGLLGEKTIDILQRTLPALFQGINPERLATVEDLRQDINPLAVVTIAALHKDIVECLEDEALFIGMANKLEIWREDVYYETLAKDNPTKTIRRLEKSK